MSLFPFSIDRRKRDAVFTAMFFELLGGQEVAAMLAERHAEGRSLRAIAAVRKIPLTSVHRRLAHAEQVLRRHGLWPPKWAARQHGPKTARAAMSTAA